MNIVRIAVITAILVCLGPGRALAQENPNPGIVPIGSDAHGRTYADLQAAWWKWATETPAPDSAVLDQTGEKCAVNQTSHVWFLAELFAPGSVTRTCKIPSGTFLFFPLAAEAYGAFLDDPAEERTEAFVRSHTTCIIGADVHAEIDGVPVEDPQQYLGQSSLFTIHFPDDNVFGVTPADIPELTLDPTAGRGYFLYLEPLPPGAHTIHMTSAPGTSLCGLPEDVTYSLIVGR
jgi:hypothetical protein